MKLSIIVPVYNVEKYVVSCLESISNQVNVSPFSYEVIVVNDGSADRSKDLIDSFSWNDSPHKIINQENKGLSGARNTGLSIADGEYVWFVDSDDDIPKNSVSEILNALDGCDILNIGHYNIKNGEIISTILPLDIQSGKDLLCAIYSIPAQYHIFRKEFLEKNKLKFLEGIYHEDNEFTPRTLYLANSIRCLRLPLYRYYIRENSIMTSLKPKRAFDYLIVASSLLNFSIENGETIKSTPLLHTICLSINNAFSIINHCNIEKQHEWCKQFRKDKRFVLALRKSTVLKYRIEGFIMSLWPFNLIQIYKMLSKLK